MRDLEWIARGCIVLGVVYGYWRVMRWSDSMDSMRSWDE